MTPCTPIQVDEKYITKEPKLIDPESVRRIVAEYYDIPIGVLISKTRRREICFPRMMAMTLIRRHCKIAHKKNGEMFGGRDHTTSVNAVKTIRDLCETDPLIKEQYDYFTNKILI